MLTYINRKIILVVFITSIFSLTSIATDLKFYNINNIFNISVRATYSICKDYNGFIWAASESGILRITDDDCRRYTLPLEITSYINVKLEYKNTFLFAYTSNGQIFLFNTLHDRFELLINISKKLKNYYLTVNRILANPKGEFWIASSIGLYKYSKGQLFLISDKSTDISYISEYSDKEFFMSSTNDLWLIDYSTNKKKLIYKNPIIHNLMVSRLFYEKNEDRLWVGTMSNGLFYFDFHSNTFAKFSVKNFPQQPILAIESITDSTLMCGIDGQGIWEIDKKGRYTINNYKENIDNPYSLRGNGVYDIYNDKNTNRIWVCTVSGGVSYYDKASPSITQITHQINNTNSLVNNDVNAVLKDSQDNIWFATNNGISCWNRKTNQWNSLYNNKKEQAQVFLTLCEDNHKRIWAGSYSSGVYVIDENSKKEVAHYTDYEKGTFRYIFSIYKDKEGNIWIGGVQGNIVCFNDKEQKFRIYRKEPVGAFIDYSPNEILLGCTYGLSLLDKKKGSVKYLSQGYIISDMLLIDNYIWICTRGEGLIRYDINKELTTKYTINAGLSSNLLNSMIYDNGYLWLGTENGLCRFKIDDNSITSFPLSNLSFNGKACYKFDDGQLLWGTNNGALLFSPDKIEQTQTKGKIFIQSLSITGQSIKDQSFLTLDSPLDSINKIHLKYNQNTFSLELIKIGTNLSGAKYTYKLEGYDNSWSTPSLYHFINYSNIPDGKYILKIRLYNSSSKIITERNIAIKISPPFWKTWWFLLLLFIVITLIISISLMYYKERLDQFHSEEKIKFFTNTTHDIRTSLTLINAPIEELNKEINLSTTGNYYLRLATEQVRRMSNIANQLLDFQKLDIGKDRLILKMVDIVSLVKNRQLMFESFALSKQIELVFSSDNENYTTAIDESKIEKVIDNLLSNAIKYSKPNTQVQIILKLNKENWSLEIKDQGIGINAKAQRKLFKEFYRAENAINSKIVGSGIGLLLSKNLVNLHDGKIVCTSNENSGSSFLVVVPYKFVEENSVDSESKKSSLVALPIDEIALPQISKKEMRILIVEDNDDLKNFLSHSLSETFHIQTASDGVEAWKTIQKQLPDLIISDIMMPNMDGFELCKKIKDTYETSHIPVILLTALSEKTDQMHGLGLGADDYLTKPFDMNLLSSKMKSIIRNRSIVKDKTLKLLKETNEEPIVNNEHNDKFIKKALEIIKMNIADPSFGKDEFASKMNVSSSLLYKKVKALTDQSPTDFVKTVRLNYAYELLESRKYTITEVGELCGFSSIGYFSTVFRKQFGKSPSEY